MSASQSKQKLKMSIREIYARIANAGTANLSEAAIASGENLARTLGYESSRLPIPGKAWDLFAGCGNPLGQIHIEPHWTIMDLGCGVGIDSQVAALSLKPPGCVVAIDITPELLMLAREYAAANEGLRCHWIAGDGEQLPLRSESVHLVIANGSFNLMPEKEKALAEIYRILKPGGYVALADLIRVGKLEPIADDLEEAWAWCVAGALSAFEYDTLLPSGGFSWWELRPSYMYGPLASAHLLARKTLAR